MVKDSGEGKDKLYTYDNRLNRTEWLIKCGMRERRGPGSFPTGTNGSIVGVLHKDWECGKSRKSDEENNWVWLWTYWAWLWSRWKCLIYSWQLCRNSGGRLGMKTKIWESSKDGGWREEEKGFSENINTLLIVGTWHVLTPTREAWEQTSCLLTSPPLIPPPWLYRPSETQRFILPLAVVRDP